MNILIPYTVGGFKGSQSLSRVVINKIARIVNIVSVALQFSII